MHLKISENALHIVYKYGMKWLYVTLSNDSSRRTVSQ